MVGLAAALNTALRCSLTYTLIILFWHLKSLPLYSACLRICSKTAHCLISALVLKTDCNSFDLREIHGDVNKWQTFVYLLFFNWIYDWVQMCAWISVFIWALLKFLYIFLLVVCYFLFLFRKNQMHDEVFRLCHKTCWCVQYWTGNGGMYTEWQLFFSSMTLFYANLSKTR